MASGVCKWQTSNSEVNIWHKFNSHVTEQAINNIFFILQITCPVSPSFVAMASYIMLGIVPNSCKTVKSVMEHW